MTKNYKSRLLFGTGGRSRIQSKLSKRQENMPIILARINIALQYFYVFALTTYWSLDDEIKTLHIHTQEQKPKQTRILK